VRSLETREVLGDSGLQASLELQSPPLAGALVLVAFYDYGRAERERPAAGTPATEDAQSLGIGLRWQFEQRVSLMLDYGHLIDGASNAPRGHERLHLTISARF
jgi:hemolysin activation/secretion protein